MLAAIDRHLDSSAKTIIDLQRALVAIPALGPLNGGPGETEKTAFLKKYLEDMYLGHVRLDRTLTEAVINQTPLARYAPQCPAIKDIATLATRVARYREENLEAIASRQALKQIPSVIVE